MDNLSLEESVGYLRMIDILDAEETMHKLKVEDWGKMKDDARNRYWNKLKNTAFPVAKSSFKEMSNADLDSWIRGSLGG